MPCRDGVNQLPKLKPLQSFPESKNDASNQDLKPARTTQSKTAANAEAPGEQGRTMAGLQMKRGDRYDQELLVRSSPKAWQREPKLIWFLSGPLFPPTFTSMFYWADPTRECCMFFVGLQLQPRTSLTCHLQTIIQRGLILWKMRIS